MRDKTTPYTVVDVFAGCGGLTRGLRDAGFKVVAAVEVDRVAAATYRYNNRKAHLIEKDVREVSSSQILAHTPGGHVDLLVGCAPCQGFCSLTAKYAREDPRNDLLLEMSRLVREIEPDALMMENVPGVATRGRLILDRFLGTLRELGYLVTYGIVQMANYGVPQSRRRFVLLAGRGFVIPLPEPTHSRCPSEAVGTKEWIPIKDALSHFGKPLALATALAVGGPESWNWHVVRDLQPQTVARLRAAKPGRTWLDVDERVRPQCHRGTYSGFTNTYGRMVWDNISPTITAGCTTPCKGRFGHPKRAAGTISVGGCPIGS